MALHSWSIYEFPGAEAAAPVTQTLLDSGGDTITLLSLFISNYSGAEATVWVKRVDSQGLNKARWGITLGATDSPMVIDSMMVFTEGDRLDIESDTPMLSVDASGSIEFTT